MYIYMYIQRYTSGVAIYTHSGTGLEHEALQL